MLKGSHTYQSCHLKNDPYQTCETSGKGYKPATTKPNSALRLPKFSWPMTNPTPEDGKHAKTRVQLPHIFHLGWSLSEGVFPIIRQREHGLHPSSWCGTLDIGEAVRLGGTSCTPSAHMAQGPRDACFHGKLDTGL